MKRIFYIVILLALTPTLVNAFGLGKLDLNSALNEPFDARIQLLSPTADELDSLKINLADNEAFARAKVDRPFILSKLRFDLRRSLDDGPDYIRVYSQDPIREPFLNFLIEVSWSNGRLFREYTVLLDPPLYDPNARASEFKQVTASDSSTAAVTLDDPDHQVVYGEAYEEFAKSSSTSASTASRPAPTYTPNVNYTDGDYGPTVGSDTLWSIASEMRPDNSVSVNQMMLALLRANPDAFINQNINNLKRGQILRMPNESEINSLSNAEALSEAQSHHSTWGDVRDNFSNNVSERPEVSSVSETSSAVVEEQVDTTPEEVVTDAELKLVSADDSGEATDQVSSVESGSGEELVLAQETIQALTQENIELKDRVQESDALLEDLKRLLSLKDDELAALQEQMAAADLAEEEMLEAAEEDVAETEEEIMEAVEEDVAKIEEEMMEVIEIEPSSDGIMGMVKQYIAKAKGFILGNPMIGMAVGGIILLLIIIIVVLKFRKEPAETVHVDAMTEEAFPDFDSGDLGDTGEDVPDSEAVTILPDSEAETALPEESADFDLDIEEEDDAKTQFMAVEETPVEEEEEEDEDDPLQEVNTYLAFEQFDQAEEFVRNVINGSPDNPEYHTKLLEVFYTSGNKKSYEESAKILHDLVAGEGEHWNMATAMWQEMSPNRALFEAGEDDAEDEADNTGGFLNVTADDEAGDSNADLDFDIGGAEDAPAAEEIPSDEEGMLDITGSDEEGMLDITGSDEEEMLDVTGSAAAEDLLDVTAAVGIDEIDSEAETAVSADSDDILDISSASGDELLDLTSGEESSGEDLLDVTAVSNLDLDSEEDLLDVTAATSAGADSSDLLDLEPDGLEIDTDNATDADTGDSNEIEFDIPAESNETVEFDLGTDEAESLSDSVEDDNVLEFDMGSDDDIEVDISGDESSETDDAGLEIELDTSSDEEEEDEPVRLDIEEESAEDEFSLDIDTEETTSDEGEISLELDMGDEEGDIELDLSIEEDEEPQAKAASDEPEIDFDFRAPLKIVIFSRVQGGTARRTAVYKEYMRIRARSRRRNRGKSAFLEVPFSLDDDTPDEAEEAKFDLDGTVELPKSALAAATEDVDDDDERTVFVPRAAQPEEQTAEDEIATKLDLAKAYVELGDKDSAKTILDEVMAEGNDEQRKQAEDLLGQV